MERVSQWERANPKNRDGLEMCDMSYTLGSDVRHQDAPNEHRNYQNVEHF